MLPSCGRIVVVRHRGGMTGGSGEGRAPAVRVLRLFSRLNIGGPSVHVILLSHGLRPLGYETRLVVGRESPREGNLLALAEERGVACETVAGLGREIAPLRDLRGARGPRSPDAGLAPAGRAHAHRQGGSPGPARRARRAGADRRPHVPRPRAARLLRSAEAGALPQARGALGARRRRARRRLRRGEAGPRGAGRGARRQDPRDPAGPRARPARGRRCRGVLCAARRASPTTRRSWAWSGGSSRSRTCRPSCARRASCCETRPAVRFALVGDGEERDSARGALRLAGPRGGRALLRLAPRPRSPSTATSTWS